MHTTIVHVFEYLCIVVVQCAVVSTPILSTNCIDHCISFVSIFEYVYIIYSCIINNNKHYEIMQYLNIVFIFE